MEKFSKVANHLTDQFIPWFLSHLLHISFQNSEFTIKMIFKIVDCNFFHLTTDKDIKYFLE